MDVPSWMNGNAFAILSEGCIPEEPEMMAIAAPADFPDDYNRLIAGRYRLLALLGVGGMGVTYRAWDTQARIPVVVKMPRREVRSDGETLQRFAREIDAMLAVSHEAIVPITDHGEDDGCPFVVMRFLPGGSLADYRRRDRAGNAIRNPPGMLHCWLPEVAAALDHIHARGMLHRDLKAGNIFLDGFLNPYLGDFGIVKVVDDSGGLQKDQTLTATNTAIGTPEYMAPELFKPRWKPDGRVDQYALAVTVYEMLSGEKPFKGDRAHIIVEHSVMPVPPLAEKVPGLPRSLCVAVEKALAKKAADRFPTCSEFAAAAVADLPMLEAETGTVRLLCPSCKNILKLPEKAAGRTGKCPQCQTALDVAADLGTLWLQSEERGGGVAGRADVERSSAIPFEEVAVDKSRRRGGVNERTGECGEAVREKASFLVRALLTPSAFTPWVIVSTMALLVVPVTWVVIWFVIVVAFTLSRVVSNIIAVSAILYGIVFGHFRAEIDFSLLLAKYGYHHELHLDGLTTLSPEVAEALADHKGSLYLNGVTTLSDETAVALAKYHGDLSLNGLTTLSDRQAEALAKHYGENAYDGGFNFADLSLNGLKTLSDRQAEALGKHKGAVHLDGLTTLSEEAAEALRNVPKIRLQGKVKRWATHSDATR